jgi:hypothetical protein
MNSRTGEPHMKKLFIAAAVLYGLLTISKAIPPIGFYVLLLPSLALLVAVIRSRSSRDGSAKLERARTKAAVHAVRKGMSYADASRQYGVSERAIRRHRLSVFHLYFD